MPVWSFENMIVSAPHKPPIITHSCSKVDTIFTRALPKWAPHCHTSGWIARLDSAANINSCPTTGDSRDFLDFCAGSSRRLFSEGCVPPSAFTNMASSASPASKGMLCMSSKVSHQLKARYSTPQSCKLSERHLDEGQREATHSTPTGCAI